MVNLVGLLLGVHYNIFSLFKILFVARLSLKGETEKVCSGGSEVDKAEVKGGFPFRLEASEASATLCLTDF